MTIAPEHATNPGQAIADLLNSHGVKVKHVTDFRGPTIVQHALALEAGTKVSKVEAMSKDIAVTLGLDDVRIVAPIPGTAYVGVEVPRAEREDVTYDDFITGDVTACQDHSHLAGALPFPVGVSIGGDPIWADLAKLPHLLIAGSTGSGKSVALNSLITSILDHRNADEVRLWLVDPKRVELGIFEPAAQVERVATNTTEAIELLQDVAEIMDARYELFQDADVRNIGEYNADAKAEVALPYHVVVIDELADLMMQSKAEVEPLIVRIAQLARAAGIHLVLATQRPTVNVVTGLIAANVVSRWVFAVRSSTDSKVALEQVGAQALYGKGDSLWSPAGSAKPIRVQGVWTSPETLERVLARSAEQHPNGAESTVGPRAATEDDPIDLHIEQPAEFYEGPVYDEAASDHYLGKTPAADYPVAEPVVYPQHRADDVDTQAQLAGLIEQMVDNAIAERDRLNAEPELTEEEAYEIAAEKWYQRFLKTGRIVGIAAAGVLAYEGLGQILGG